MRLQGDLSWRSKEGPEFFPGVGPVDAEDDDDDKEDDDKEDGQEETTSATSPVPRSFSKPIVQEGRASASFFSESEGV